MINFTLGLLLLPILIIATVFITQLCNLFKDMAYNMDYRTDINAKPN